MKKQKEEDKPNRYKRKVISEEREKEADEQLEEELAEYGRRLDPDLFLRKH